MQEVDDGRSGSIWHDVEDWRDGGHGDCEHYGDQSTSQSAETLTMTAHDSAAYREMWCRRS